MRKLFVFKFLFILFVISCTSNKVLYDNIKTKVYSNKFNFLLTEYDNRRTYSVPAGTGRILSSNTQVRSTEFIGITIDPDKFSVNLPLNDKESSINKSSIEFISQDFTVARKDLDNGNILLNYFLNDQKEITIVKMEVTKTGRIDCSIEGPKQKPLLYLGTLDN